MRRASTGSRPDEAVGTMPSTLRPNCEHYTSSSRLWRKVCEGATRPARTPRAAPRGSWRTRRSSRARSRGCPPCCGRVGKRQRQRARGGLQQQGGAAGLALEQPAHAPAGGAHSPRPTPARPPVDGVAQVRQVAEEHHQVGQAHLVVHGPHAARRLLLQVDAAGANAAHHRVQALRACRGRASRRGRSELAGSQRLEQQRQQHPATAGLAQPLHVGPSLSPAAHAPAAAPGPRPRSSALTL